MLLNADLHGLGSIRRSMQIICQVKLSFSEEMT